MNRSRWIRDPAGVLWAAYAAALAAVAVAALVFKSRFYPELGYDESASILGLSILSGHFGNHPDPRGLLGFERHHVMDCYPPVYYLAQAFVYKLAGFGIVSARATSAIFVGATSLLCFWGARRIAGAAAGFLAMAAYLMVPLQVYTLVARPDVAVPFFVLASILALATAGSPAGRWRYFLAGTLCSFAVLSHFVALMAVPVVAVLLWHRVGARFWRSAGFWAFALGAAIPLLAYAVLLYPHYLPTWQHFTRYADVGLASAATSVRDRWPLRPSLQHLRHLQDHLPWLLYALVPASVAVLVARVGVPTLRERVTTAGWLLCACFLALLLLVGAYPNIAVYGYYGPVYLALAAVVAGYCLILPLPPRWARGSTAVALGAAAATAMTALVIHDALRAEKDARGIPLTAALDWTFDFPRLKETKVLATPHWVFSAAGDRTRTPRILELHDGKPIVSRAYRSEVPGSGGLGDYGAAIYDKWNEHGVILRLVDVMAARGEQSEPGVADPGRKVAAERWKQVVRMLAPEEQRWAASSPFGPLEMHLVESRRVAGIFHDDVRLSSDYSVFEDGPPPGDDAWPRMARATPGGPERLAVSSDCTVSMAGSKLPPASHWAPWLTSHVLPLEAVPELGDLPLAVRIVVAKPDEPATPLGFAAYYPDRGFASTARRELAAYRAPPLAPGASLGLLGVRLGGGQVGREMLVKPGAPGSGGMLTIHQVEGRGIGKIDIGLALPQGRTCDAALSDALRRIVERALHPPPALPTVLSVAEGSSTGIPTRLRMSAPVTGHAIIWRSGSVVGRQEFRDVPEIVLALDSPGAHGVEVWISPGGQGEAKLSEVVYFSVHDNP